LDKDFKEALENLIVHKELMATREENEENK